MGRHRSAKSLVGHTSDLLARRAGVRPGSQVKSSVYVRSVRQKDPLVRCERSSGPSLQGWQVLHHVCGVSPRASCFPPGRARARQVGIRCMRWTRQSMRNMKEASDTLIFE